MANFLGVAQLGGEHGGHELHRVVGFQIRGVVGDDGVGGGVGLVETVLGELVEEVENLVGLVVGNAVETFSALDKLDAFLGHGVGVFFAHGAAKHVCAAKGVAADDTGTLHHLLLVYDHAESLGQNRFEQRVGIDDGGRVFFAACVVGNEGHGARAVESGDRVDVVYSGDTDLAGGTLHAAGLELKDADSFSGVEELVGDGIVEGEGLEIEVGSGSAADVFYRVGEDGEGF